MFTLSSTPAFLGLSAMLAGLAWSAASDLRHFLIPNRACALVAGGFVIAGLALPMQVWLPGLAVGLATLAVGAVLFARGWVGGGDVKLAAAIALWAGSAFFSGFLFTVSIAAIGLAVVLMSPMRGFVTAAGARETGFQQPMPFGAPLALGGVYVAAMHLAALIGRGAA